MQIELDEGKIVEDSEFSAEELLYTFSKCKKAGFTLKINKTIYEINDISRILRPVFISYNVNSVLLFGSYAKNKAGWYTNGCFESIGAVEDTGSLHKKGIASYVHTLNQRKG